MAHISEYDVENLFIDRLESIGYEFVDMSNYDDVCGEFPQAARGVQCAQAG